MQNFNQLTVAALVALTCLQGTLALPPSGVPAPKPVGVLPPVPLVATETSEQMKVLQADEAKDTNYESNPEFEAALKLHEDAIKNYEEAINNLQKQYTDNTASITELDYQINSLKTKMEDARKSGDNDQQHIDALLSKLNKVADRVIENDYKQRENAANNAYLDIKKKDRDFHNLSNAGVKVAVSEATAKVAKKMAEDAAKGAEASKQKFEKFKKLYGQ